MSPEARAEARRLADEDLKEMPLHELRAARHLTQQQLAKSLDMTQAAVSQLEQRTDVYLSTLENFVEAMGGRLEMYARHRRHSGGYLPLGLTTMELQEIRQRLGMSFRASQNI
jgi:DNA-binding Xre family transcriptional regulator